jgi:hypothetical protein
MRNPLSVQEGACAAFRPSPGIGPVPHITQNYLHQQTAEEQERRTTVTQGGRRGSGHPLSGQQPVGPDRMSGREDRPVTVLLLSVGDAQVKTVTPRDGRATRAGRSGPLHQAQILK